MNPELETRLKSEAERFELLEHPELWPDDPALQAELAELLELHLALQAHGPELRTALRPVSAFQRLRSHGLMAAAALFLAVVPTLYVLQHDRALRQQRATIEASAQRRAQIRSWSAFFEQSSELIKRFDRNPPVCDKDHEDRSEERVLAMALLEASRQLAGQAVDVPEAETARNELHFWLTELSLEDGCLSPERAQELRQLASNQDLERQAQRLGELLKGEGS
jgi:hypothetical protein